MPLYDTRGMEADSSPISKTLEGEWLGAHLESLSGQFPVIIKYAFSYIWK